MRSPSPQGEMLRGGRPAAPLTQRKQERRLVARESVLIRESLYVFPSIYGEVGARAQVSDVLTTVLVFLRIKPLTCKCPLPRSPGLRRWNWELPCPHIVFPVLLGHLREHVPDLSFYLLPSTQEQGPYQDINVVVLFTSVVSNSLQPHGL